MGIRKALFSLIVALFAVGALYAQPADEARPRNVILFISDGCGPASFTFARDYLRYKGDGEALAIDPLQVGSIHTYSTNSRVTDSAAGATAFACGVKSYNGAIAVDTLRQPVATILEAAEARGMATGLVVTSTMTHATPAAFSAHVHNRGMVTIIAAQQMEQGIEVMFGGGVEDFLPKSLGGSRGDERNLLKEAAAKGYKVVLDRKAFRKVKKTPVLGLFSEGQMDYDIDRDPKKQPSLAEMTAKAIDLLKDDPDGFFLMVEGSRIDHAAHGNDAAAHLHDILAFDEAVAAALDFARQDGQTLLVSTSDHETGGLSLGRNVDGQAKYTWNPEVIEKITASHDRIGELLLEGTSLDVLVQEQFGIDDLTEQERAVADSAYAARDGGALFAAFSEMVSRRVWVGWTSGGHTAVDVNLYAFGPGRDHFIGHHDNTVVGQRIAEIMGFDLQAMTEAMREEASR